MARTRDIAPYPSPSPKLYDEEVPRLEDQDLRDGYDKQFRINQRLKRWGIVIADIINALDIGGWDPSTKVVWVGDGEDADYTTITEALLSISPSSYDPRVVVVFPGTYFDRLYIPPHTSIYGLGQRGMVKIWVDASNGETMIEGGNQNIHFANLDIQQRIASATGTKVIELNATDVSFDNVYIENLATDADSEGVVIENSSLSTAKCILLNNVHIKGNNSARHTTVTTRLDDDIFTEVWPFNDYLETWPENTHCRNLKQNTSGFTFTANAYRASTNTSPFGDDSVEQYHAHGNGAGSTGQVLTGAQADAADAVSLSARVRYDSWDFAGVGNMGSGIYQDIMSMSNIGGTFTGLHLALRWADKKFVAIHGRTTYHISSTFAQSDEGARIGEWYRLDAAYNKNTGDLMLWVNGKLVGYANKPKAYVYAGNTQRVDMTLHVNNSENTALCDLMRYSEIAAANGWINPWEFVRYGKQDISTLRLSSKYDEGTAQGNIRLNNVLVENDTPNNNIIIGDAPFELHGVVSKLAQANNESKNIVVRNDTDNNQVHIFGSVASLFGENSLVFDTPRARITANRGGYFGNRPTYVPPTIKRAFFDEDWTQRPSEGQISAHDFFEGNYLGDKNILYHGELDVGHVYPKSNVSWFESVGVDGDLTVTGFISGTLSDPAVARNFVANEGHFWRRQPRLIGATASSGSDPSSWDLKDEDWEDITDWTSSAAGTNTIEENPSGQLHLVAGDGGGTNSTADKYKTGLITSVNDFTVEFKVKFDQLVNWNSENNDFPRISLFNGTNQVYLNICKDEIRYLNSGGSWTTLVADAISTGVWYTYRILISSPATNGYKLRIYRGTELLVSTSNLYAAAGGNGEVYVQNHNYSASPTTTETHHEYIKIATGLYIPVIESTAYTEKTADIDPTLINDGVDTDHLMPQKDLDTLLTFSGGDKDHYIHFASDASISWNEIDDQFEANKDFSLNEGNLFQYKLDSYLSNTITCYSDAAEKTGQLLLRKSHQNTIGYTETVDGERIGRILFKGVDNVSNLDNVAAISCLQDGAAGGRVPGSILFEVSTTTVQLNDAMLIDANSYLNIEERLYFNAADGSQENADAYIYFATDAYTFWDEDQDRLIFSKPITVGNYDDDDTAVVENVTHNGLIFYCTDDDRLECIVNGNLEFFVTTNHP